MKPDNTWIQWSYLEINHDFRWSDFATSAGVPIVSVVVLEPGFDEHLPGASASKHEPTPARAGALWFIGIVMAELQQN